MVNDLKADQEACIRTEVYGVKQKPGKTSQNDDLCGRHGPAATKRSLLWDMLPLLELISCKFRCLIIIIIFYRNYYHCYYHLLAFLH